MEKVVDKIKRGISKDSTISDEEVITTPGIAILSNYNNLEKDYSFDYSSTSQFPNIPPPSYSDIEDINALPPPSYEVAFQNEVEQIKNMTVISKKLRSHLWRSTLV